MKPRLLSVLVLTLIVMASACSPAQTPTAAPPTSAPTQAFTLATSIKDIVGTWRNAGTNRGLLFNADGTYRSARHYTKLTDEPNVKGKFWFEATKLFLQDTETQGVPPCPDDSVPSYEARLEPSGNLLLVVVQDNCPGRAGSTALEYEPVR